jgi:hypothetical protein
MGNSTMKKLYINPLNLSQWNCSGVIRCIEKKDNVWSIKSDEKSFLFDFDKKVATIKVGSSVMKIPNIFLHTYTNLLGSRTPVIMVLHGNKITSFCILSHSLCLSSRVIPAEDINNVTLLDLVTTSSCIFGTGIFTIDKEKLKMSTIREDIVR